MILNIFFSILVICIGYYLFYRWKSRIREEMEDRREDLRQKRQETFDQLLKSKKKTDKEQDG